MEGAFARAFRSDVRPVELGRRLTREMDDQRSVDVSGRTMVPNHFVFLLSEHDLDQLAGIGETLILELVDAAREHARDERYTFKGAVTVELEVDSSLKVGTFDLEATWREFKQAHGAMTVSALVLPDGERVALGDQPVVIGRHPGCDVAINDPNISRKHAEIRPTDAGYEIVDLGSTNLTRVNGLAVGHQELRPGDDILLGASRIRFEVVDA